MRNNLGFVCMSVFVMTCLVGAGCASRQPVPTVEDAIPSDWQSTIADDGSYHFVHPARGERPVPSMDGDLALDLGTTVTGTKAIDVPELSLIVRRVPWESEWMKACYYSEQGWSNGRGPTLSKKTFDGHEYCIVESLDAAAGNRYFTRSYATRSEADALVFQFTVHSTECANYDDQSKCVYFDKDRDTVLMDRVMKTVNVK